MRIPLKKIYRAFPEFDTFADEQCQRFMLRVQLSGAKKAVPNAVGVGVAVVMLMFGCAFMGFIFEVIYEQAGRSIRQYEVFMDLITFSIPPLSACLLGLLSRDILLRRHLRLVIEDKLNRIRCLACKYILIGQTVVESQVRCPECGLVHTLQELGVVEADLIPPTNDEVTAFAPDH